MTKYQCLGCQHLDIDYTYVTNVEGKQEKIYMAVCTGTYNPWQIPLSIEGQDCDVYRAQGRR